MRAVVAVLAASAACVPPDGTVQRDWARYLVPAQVRARGAPAPGTAPRSMRVRAWADAGYRAHASDWGQRIHAQVARASVITEAEFGVTLVLEAVHDWERDDASTVQHATKALRAHDPGEGVDWVFGFTGPVPGDSWGHETLGAASGFGKHAVLRAMESDAVHRAVGQSFDRLGPDEREALVQSWRVHKETATFLHEWAHTLGAVHECEARSIMASTYGFTVDGFSPAAARLVTLGLRHRADATAWAEAYRVAAERDLAREAFDCPALEVALAEASAALGRRAHALRMRDPTSATARWYQEATAVLKQRALPVPARDASGAELRVRLHVEADGRVARAKVERGAGAGADGDLERTLHAITLPPPPEADRRVLREDGATFAFRRPGTR